MLSNIIFFLVQKLCAFSYLTRITCSAFHYLIEGFGSFSGFLWGLSNARQAIQDSFVN